VRHRRATERLVEHGATSAMPTVFGEFRTENPHNRGYLRMKRLSVAG
jgi:hypothetical protein